MYKPVWQLLAGLQSVLDSCDQEEREWVRAKGEAAAAALEAAYEAQEAAAAGGGGMCPWDGAAAVGSMLKGSPKKAEAQQSKQQQGVGQQQQAKGVGQFASEAAAAAAAEAAVLKHCEQCLLDLQQEAEQLVAELAVKKDEATAAAGGRGAAADVAEAAAKLLRPMLKALRHEAKDANKLRKRLEAAAEATDAAAAAASGIAATAAKSALKLQRSLLRKGAEDSGSSSDSSSSSSSADSESVVSTVAESRSRSSSKGKRRQLKREKEVLAAAEQQQQQQGARLQRLQSASQVLAELDRASAKLERQLLEAQQRLQDMAAAGAGPAAGNHHDNGLIAAGTAGLTASLSAGLRAYHSTSSSLTALIQSLGSAAGAAAADAFRVSERVLSCGGGSQPQQQRSGSLLHSPPTPRGEQTVHFSTGDSSGGGSGSKLLGRSVSSRLGDSALAGTWGVQEAAAGAGAAVPLLSPRNGSEQVSSGAGSTYDAAAHYLVGAAAAATVGRNSAGSGSSRLTAGGLGLSVNPDAAAAASEGWRVLRSAPNSPRSLSLSGKTALAEQLQGARSGGGALGGSSNVSGGSSPRSDAAAEAVHAVHAQLAGLSRQASRLSLKANAILAAGGTEAAGGTGGLRALSGSSSLAGSLRQREGLGAGSSPFSAPLSPRGGSLSGVSPRGGLGLGGLGTASTFGGSGGSPPTTGSLLSSATRSALLGHAGGRGVGLWSVGLSSVGARPALNSSFSSGYSGSLLKGGALGGLGGSSGSALGMGNSALLRAAGDGMGKLGVSSVPGVAAGTSSSLAAISSRLHSLTHGGR